MLPLLHPTGSRRRRTALLGLAASVACAAPAAATPARSVYIVQLADAPIATYTGGTEGIPATAPRATGRSLNTRSAAARDYVDYLDGRQDDALDSVRGAAPDVAYAYRTTFAGFAAEMTPAQAAQLERSPEVASVSRDELNAPDAGDDVLGGPDANAPWIGGDTAAWLRLTGPLLSENATTGVAGGGLWSRVGEPTATNGPGSGMVIADLDSGITETNPAFADEPAAGQNYSGAPFTARPASFTGSCEAPAGGAFTGCNQKVIAARTYNAGIALSGPIVTATEGSVRSARDVSGHGTHTAGIAAGNYGVTTRFGDRTSGVAPRAQLAVYKVCWDITYNGTPQNLCANSDVLAATEQAVRDGADVITQSITNGATNTGNKMAGFLAAYDAGVFVASSAGNSGPGAGTVSSGAAPWLTSVAASTTNRKLGGTVRLGGGATDVLPGVSVTTNLAATPIVDAEDAPKSPTTSSVAQYCGTGTLDPAVVTGKVVLCRRGNGIARLDKAATVKAAGGLGMVLGEESPSGVPVEGDAFTIPGVAIANADFLTLKARIDANPGTLTAQLSSERVARTPSEGRTPRLADFSSTGPQQAAADLPGPDVSAPGVSVLSSYLNVNGQPGAYWLNGTSMSTPVVAGSAALLLQRHPAWQPETIKSALATTATTVKAVSGPDDATPLQVGSGQIDPNRADDPGLVVTPTRASIGAFQADPDATAGGLNLPSIIAFNMGGITTVSRRFTSVDTGAAHTWTISAEAPAGTVVTTVPALGSQAQIAACGSLDVAVTIKQGDSGTLDAAAVRSGGALVLTDETGRTVRVPISVRPQTVGAPRVLSTYGATAAPAWSIPTSVGADGAPTVTASIAGPAFTEALPVSQTTDATAGTVAADFDIPANTPAVIAGAISNANNAGADVDLYLYTRVGSTLTRIASSTNVGSTDSLAVFRPAVATATTYRFVLHGFAAPANTKVDFDLWNTSNAAGGKSLTVTGAPATVTTGDRFTLSASSSNLDPGTDYFGVVTTKIGSGLAGGTGLFVDRSATAPTGAPISTPAERSPSGCAVPPTPTATPGPTPTPTPDLSGQLPTPTPTAGGGGNPPNTPGGTPGAGPGPTPPARPAPTLKAGVPSLAARRALSVKLTASEEVRVTVAAFKKAKVLAKVPVVSTKVGKRLGTKQRKVTFQFSKALPRGSYTLVFTVQAADGRTATKRLTLTVR